MAAGNALSWLNENTPEFNGRVAVMKAAKQHWRLKAL